MSQMTPKQPIPVTHAWSSKTQGHLTRYWRIAIAVALVDWFAKWFAVRQFGVGNEVALSERFSLFVTFNTGSAGGVMFGPYTVSMNILVTTFALVLITSVVRELATLDSRARVALGMVAGGAIGNLGSMLFGPAGVADFLAVRVSTQTTIIANAADLALWTGALLLAPVVLHLVVAIHAQQRVRQARTLVGV